MLGLCQPLANIEMGGFTFPEAPVSNPCNNIVLWWTFMHPLHPVMAFACCVTCPTLTFAESMEEKPFLQAHGEVDLSLLSRSVTLPVTLHRIMVATGSQRSSNSERWFRRAKITGLSSVTLLLLGLPFALWTHQKMWYSFWFLPTSFDQGQKDGRGKKRTGRELQTCELQSHWDLLHQKALVDWSCIRLNGGLCIAIPFGNGLLAVMGIFLPPVEEVPSRLHKYRCLKNKRGNLPCSMACTKKKWQLSSAALREFKCCVKIAF